MVEGCKRSCSGSLEQGFDVVDCCVFEEFFSHVCNE